jgi:hypothetical protein
MTLPTALCHICRPQTPVSGPTRCEQGTAGQGYPGGRQIEPVLPDYIAAYMVTMRTTMQGVQPHAASHISQRALEVGEWHRATTEKLRLEEKQRQVSGHC